MMPENLNIQQISDAIYTEGLEHAGDVSKHEKGAVFVFDHVKWVHCHLDVARRQVADREDGLQMWRVAANILNNQLRTADSGWSSELGLVLLFVRVAAQSE
jgi:hypothetical protein